MSLSSPFIHRPVGTTLLTIAIALAVDVLPAAAALAAGRCTISRQSRKILGKKPASAIVLHTTMEMPSSPILKIGGMGTISRATVNTIANA